MKFISLFAGIGGLDLGLERAGMECVAQVEIDDYCQKILTKHWANVPKFKDVRDVGKHNLPTADLICGGFPCQDVSLAGKMAGLEGKRSTLWSEFIRIVCEIRPRWVVIENVVGLLSSDNGEFARKIFRELAESGYDAEWQVVSAAGVGAPHQRERVIIIAYPNNSGYEFSIFAQGELPERPCLWQSFGTIDKRVWLTEHCGLLRDDDGLPSKVDAYRFKMTGNAVVPQIAEFVGSAIVKAETRLTQRPPDVGDSPRPQALSTTEAGSLAQVKASPAPRR